MTTNQITSAFIALTAILLFGTGCASTKAEAPADAQAHQEHHPEGQANQKTDTSSSEKPGAGMMGGGMMNGGMMGKMDMNQMKGMMQKCMAMHKDGKMCDHQMMTKCQENMDQRDCMKMMTDSKKQTKSK
jgi:hypothetical protein